MAASKTTKSTRPARAKAPRDHQPKRAMIARRRVPMDKPAVLDHAEAELALAKERARLEEDRDVRVAREMLRRREATQSGEAGPDLQLVRAEVDVAIADELEPLTQAIAAAQKRVEQSTRLYEFRALGNVAYERLLKAHKPTDDDHEQVKAEGQGTRALFHAETFGPALVEACCADIDLAEVEEMFNGGEWNLEELADLFMAAYEVNTQRTVLAR